MTEIVTTGTCICGHSFDDHHHGAILNPKGLAPWRNVNGWLGEECEATQVHGYAIVPATEPLCFCETYRDKGWPK